MRQSLWIQDTNRIPLQSLQHSVSTDICIVGGGICGVYTAFLLTKQGIKVTLLEAHDSLANQTTANSTGKLTVQHGDIYAKLLEQFSVEDVRKYVNVNKKAIEQAIREANKEIYSKANSYLFATTNEGTTKLVLEREAYEKIGLKSLFTRDTELPFAINRGLMMGEEHQINPVQFTEYFARRAIEAGAAIHTSSRVIHVDKSKHTVFLHQGVEVKYKKLIFCTHYPIDAIRGLYLIKLEVNRSYLCASKTEKLLTGQYYSLDQLERTIRTANINNESWLIYGGGSHQAGTVEHTEDYYDTLASEVSTLFPNHEPVFSWSAQDVETPDKIPYVGPMLKGNDSIYIATGFRKWGLSNSLVAAEILLGYCIGKKHEASELYSPQRSNFGAKLAKMLKLTGFVTSSFVGGHVSRIDAPTCTHIGCKTRWNNGDGTWDCPCHGSRFNKDGVVLEGPAVKSLKIKKQS